ncbi:hypothetical protein ACO0SA_001317 [Hanseniaspora valbyensis]
MQYFGKALGSVTKSWSAINPATLSGAVDVIVVEHADGELSCSPFHVRFGKFQVLKPSQKKVDVFINGQATTIPMKLSDHGEAQFIFEFLGEGLPEDMFASSPVASVASSPMQTPTKMKQSDENTKVNALEEPDFLDINQPYSEQITPEAEGRPIGSQNGNYSYTDLNSVISTPSSPHFNPIKEKLEKIKIPTKVDNFTGDLLLDIEGYKSSKNKIHDSDELVQQILRDEFGEDMLHKIIEKDDNGNIRLINNAGLASAVHSLDASAPMANTAINVATNGVSSGIVSSLRDNSPENEDDLESTPLYDPGSPTSVNSDSTFNSLNTSTIDNKNNNISNVGVKGDGDSQARTRKYIKTLRLTSDQLKCLNLKHGTNDLKFVIDKGSSQLEAKLYLWKWDTPIVISDIDGTITKSDALGHVMAMIGKDWTHAGVAKLFTDIHANGYNIMYLTARSAGLADNTRAYLRSINQDGFTIPEGPVILSPDRTFTALKREVILKKPEVFKMACLNDIRKLYLKDLSLDGDDEEDDRETDIMFKKREVNEKGVPMKLSSSSAGVFDDDMPTPFIAGFGNRITDGISYRSVGIPRSRIFTINPYGEVHMELLELSGYKSSYLFINELVDHFFPPVIGMNGIKKDTDNELNAFNDTDFKNTNKANEALQAKMTLFRNKEGKFTDSNYWKEPLMEVSDLSDDDDGSDDGFNVSNDNNETGEERDTYTTMLGRKSSSSNGSFQRPRTFSSTNSTTGGNGSFNSYTSPLQNKKKRSSGSQSSDVFENNGVGFFANQRNKSNSISHNRTKSNDSRFFSWGGGNSNNNNSNDRDYQIPSSIHDDELSPQALNKAFDTSTDIFENHDGESPKEFGKKVYLELNSPLSSPKASIFDDDYISKKLPSPAISTSNSYLDKDHIESISLNNEDDHDNNNNNHDEKNINPQKSNKLIFNDQTPDLENDEFDEDDEFEI